MLAAQSPNGSDTGVQRSLSLSSIRLLAAQAGYQISTAWTGCQAPVLQSRRQMRRLMCALPPCLSHQSRPARSWMLCRLSQPRLRVWQRLRSSQQIRHIILQISPPLFSQCADAHTDPKVPQLLLLLLLLPPASAIVP